MISFIWFVVGMIVGTFTGVFVTCLIITGRTNDYSRDNALEVFRQDS